MKFLQILNRNLLFIGEPHIEKRLTAFAERSDIKRQSGAKYKIEQLGTFLITWMSLLKFTRHFSGSNPIYMTFHLKYNFFIKENFHPDMESDTGQF